MKQKALWAAVPYTVPVMLGYLFLGAAFGVLTAENGFSVLWAFLMSTFIYAGSMQFAAISLIVVGPDRFLLFSMAGILAALLLFRKEISK